MIMAKDIKSLYPGETNATPTFSAIPMKRPPSSAPQTFPAPPNSMAANAFIILVSPIKGSRLVSSASKIPPTPAKTEARDHTARLTRFMLMPIIAASSMLSATALRDFPSIVLVNKK